MQLAASLLDPTHRNIKMRVVRHGRSFERPAVRLRLKGESIQGLPLSSQIETRDPPLLLQRLPLKSPWGRDRDRRANTGKELVPLHSERAPGDSQVPRQSVV